MASDDSHDDRTQPFVALTSGTAVSHYKIIEKIGAGGMGEVYLAEDTELVRNVALKFLPSYLRQDEECRKRFKREAQAAAKLNHPTIVTIHEVGEHQGRPYFVMEHVEGRSLRDIKSEELDIDRIIGIAIQLCDGLHSAHTAGITHRDIKPSNIIIDSGGRPKLLDFGLATVRGGEHLTRTGSTLGTVGYMSPEQIEGKVTDARSDLFSLGVVLYELIANKAPFRRDDETATLKAILQDTPEPLARYKAGLSNDFQRIITKLLEKDPSLRYQSAAGVIPDLKKLSRELTSSVVTKKRRDWPNRNVVPVVAVVLLVMIGFWYWQYRPDTESDGAKSLVVLPFDNLGDPEDEYFSDGMTDEITARLAGLSGLRVCSRTSAFHYKGSDKPLKAIARELDVDYVLEGTIRWDKSGDISRVRIIPQLVRASDDSHVWANTFERALTEVFTVQADIAEQVVNALNINLLSEERYDLRQSPTIDMAAYDYYLRGRELYHSFRDRRDVEMAATMFEKAASIDTSFAAAYAELSRTHSTVYWFGYDRSDERSDKARSAAEQAMVLDSSTALARAALGYCYYYFERDFDKALLEFEIARRNSPNDADLLAAIGYIKRRQGEWEESYDYQERALALNPLSRTTRLNLHETACHMRRFDDAEIIAKKGLELFPDDLNYYVSMGVTFVARDGDAYRALQLLDSAPPGGVRSKDEEQFMRWWFNMLLRRYEDALAAILNLVEYCQTPEDSAGYFIDLAETYRLLGQTSRSRVYYDSALAYIETLDARGLAVGGFLPPSPGLVYSRLGEKERAIEAARRDTARLSLSDDAYLGAEPLTHLAVTYLRVGEHDKALDLIDTLLSIPSSLTAARLRLDPDYDPLRDHPRFQQLIEKYEKKHGI